jgi:hypothetical protein
VCASQVQPRRKKWAACVMIGTRRRPSRGAVDPFLASWPRGLPAALARLPALSGGGASRRRQGSGDGWSRTPGQARARPELGALVIVGRELANTYKLGRFGLDSDDLSGG